MKKDLSIFFTLAMAFVFVLGTNSYSKAQETAVSLSDG